MSKKLTLSYSEKSSIKIELQSDDCLGNVTPLETAGYICHFMIKPNNSVSDDNAIMYQQKPVTNSQCIFEISTAENKAMGEGVHWYDIWVTHESTDYRKPLIWGDLVITKLTNWGD